MKKRLKGLACWWLVLVMLVGTLATPAMAASYDTIYIYSGTEPLEANDDLYPRVRQELSKGMQLSSYDPSQEDGVTLTGWKLWEIDNINSGLVVTNELGKEDADYTLTADDIENYGNGRYFAFEPLYAYSIDVYTGENILSRDDTVDSNDIGNRQITLDSPLNEQTSLSDRVTDNLIGWKLWENDSLGLIRPKFYEADGTLSADDINSKSLLEAVYATAVVAKNNEPLGYFYNGNVNNDKLIHVDLGTALNEQSTVMNELAPSEENVLNGWKLWRYTYCGGVLIEEFEEEGNIISPKSVECDYAVTKEDVMTIGTIFYEYFLVLEPLWMSKWKIDPQPTGDAPTVGVKEYDEINGVWTDITDDPGLGYQWYEESIENYYLTDEHSDLISASEAIYFSEGIWYLEDLYTNSWPVELFLDQGVTVRVETVGPTEIDSISLNGHSFENKGEHWELTLTEAVDTYLEVLYNETPVENEDGVKIQITEKSLGDTIDGQTSKTLTADEDGTYVCKVTLPNGYVLTSDAVDYAPPAHTHSYTYTASDSVIYENCTCSHSQTAEVMAPVGTIIYDSTEKKGATVSYSDAWEGGELTVNYSNNVDAGTATASITKDGETASVTFTIAKATIDSVSFDAAAPEALADKQTTVENGTGYTAVISWDISDVKFGFNTAYTATVTLTADRNHHFVDSIGKDGWTKTADGDVLTFTKTFDKTRKEKLESLTNAPANKTLAGYHASVSEAIAELPTTVTYETELGNKTADIQWACANYNSVPAQTNTFTWSVKDGELSDYDVNGMATSGNITVTNVSAIGVTHSKTDKETTYNGNTYDVSQMFTIGTTTGTVSYEIVAGGTGAGTLSGTNLTITKAGTIDIKMSTAANAQYAASDITATLTVNKADGTGSVEINGWTYGDMANDPQIASATNGTENATCLYESTDDKGYSDSNAPQNAGEYKVTVTFAETDLYEEVTAYANFTIAQKSVAGATVGTFDAMTYDGTAKTPVATVTVDGLTATGTWSDVTNVADTSTFIANGNFTGTIENVNVGMSKASQSAPTTPAAVNETIKAKADGKLTGVTSDMEYKSEGASEYIAISETEIENLAAGTYLVRYKEDANHFASADTQVVIAEGALITVSFNSNEGTTVESETCEYNQAITAPAEPTKDGFVFAGWYQDEECLNLWNFNNTLTEDITLYAKWNDKPVYSISGKVTDGDTGLGGIAVTLKQGNTIIATTTTAADGSYSFIAGNGFYNIVAEKEESDSSTIKTVKIEVKESADVNDVVFVATDINSELEIKSDTPQIIVGGLDEEAQSVSSNNENADVMVKMTVESQEDITESDNVEGQQHRQTEQKEIKEVSGNKYIQFIEISLTQSISGAESTKLEETSGLIEIIIPFEKGNKRNVTVYRYHGEIAEKLGEGSENANADGEYFEVKENHIVVYAKKFSTYAIGYDLPSSSSGSGTTRYTVKFDTDGGSSLSNVTVIRNSKVAEPKVPEKEGYTFMGWFTDKNYETLYDFNKTVTKGFTLYAKWEKHDDEPQGTDTHNCPSLAFDDIDITQWYHLDTDYVIENGIFNGTTETTFEPDAAQTRAMMITILYRAEGEPGVNRSIPFADVDMSAYYANAVIWGQQNGIIKGYSETEFGPDDKITREQIAAIMHRYAQYKGIDVSVGENTNILSYDDFADISEYAIPSMQWAFGAGIMKGKTESTLNPLDNATRAETAAILHRFIEANK